MAPKARRRAVTYGSGHRTGAVKKTTSIRLSQPSTARRLRLPTPFPSFGELTPKQLQVRGRVFQAVSLYRRSITGRLGEDVSLSEALKRAGTTLESFLKFPGLYRVQPDGSIRVTRGDTYKRQVQIVIPLRYRDGDTRTLFVRSSREATIAGQYANVVKKVLAGKADPAILKQFEGVTVGGYKLLTDVAALRRVADAGRIRIDEFGSGQELRGGEQ